MPTATSGPAARPVQASVHRIEVRPKAGMLDPKGAAVAHDARGLGLAPTRVAASRVYLIEGALDQAQLLRIQGSLLVDPVTEVGRIAARGDAAGAGLLAVEVHPLPGVMDPVAQSVRDAIRDLVGAQVEVSTGWRYEIDGLDRDGADRLARRLLANPVVHAIHHGAHHPESLPKGHRYSLAVREVRLRGLDDAALERLSREAHLFLDLAEMRAIQAQYESLGREPREIELETLAQTWSEHCVHKTLKSVVRYGRGGGIEGQRGSGESETAGQRDSETGGDPIRWRGRPGHVVNADGSVTINNLLKSTVAAATHELIADGVDWCLSVFEDNAGIIAFDDEHAVCVKVETHNHPSAIEPYGGAATGIGGCIRDILGTGLGAKPIASTDVFCVAFPDGWGERPNKEGAENAKESRVQASGSLATSGPSAPSAASAVTSQSSAFGSTLPAGCLHPKRVLTEVVAGVRDYGNRMGIPTVSGAVWFDDRHIGNPLVFCGCVGVMPRWAVGGKARAGDRIIALGGRTGRDGIHGATFSSAELTDTHADEFAHAVQIGNAIEEKRVLDVVLRARDWGSDGATERRSDGGKGGDGPASRSPSSLRRSVASSLFSAITDCGAGGFSSAVGEMGADLGATVHLERAPLKYEGLSPTEIWISEAQERMVLAVPAGNVEALAAICREEGVEWADLGEFGHPDGDLVLLYHGTEVGRLSMHFLHEGIPTPTRDAMWGSDEATERRSDGGKGETAGQRSSETGPESRSPSSLRRCVAPSLLALLSHPNIASKHWIIRQYDHEVQGRTVVKPLVGPGAGPSDAAIVEPVPGSGKGLAISQGLATGHMVAMAREHKASGDPYWMTLAAIDECVRNLVCVGADPSRVAILDNFCWPSCKKPENLGSLVRAAEGCYDGAKAYRTPFVSGKDSLNNQFTIPGEGGSPGRTIEIPPTLLITGIGIVPEIERAVTMDAKRAGNLMVLVGRTQEALAGSHLAMVAGRDGATKADGLSSPAFGRFPTTDLEQGPRVARLVHEAIRAGLVASAHDVSDGGLLCAIAEMLIAAAPVSGDSSHGTNALGAELLPPESPIDPLSWAFGESASRYVLEVAPGQIEALRRVMGGVACEIVGQLNESGRLVWADAGVDEAVARLREAWTRPLDW